MNIKNELDFIVICFPPTPLPNSQLCCHFIITTYTQTLYTCTLLHGQDARTSKTIEGRRAIFPEATK